MNTLDAIYSRRAIKHFDPDHRIIEELLDRVLEADSEHRGRNRSDDQESGVAERLFRSLQDPYDEVGDARAVDHADRDQRRQVDGDFEGDPGELQTEQGLGDDEVAGAGDREELGRALHHSEKNRLPECHADDPARRIRS